MNDEQPTVERDRLKEYSGIKLSLASQLRLFSKILELRRSESREKQCRELMVKLAEDRFTLAVLGQFKRGKSSLMNAIIGRELLPTGVLPLTSAITVLKFGSQERLVVEREGWAFPEIVPVTRLEDYVTERGNPSNQKKVKTATVEVPVKFLRRGLEFVDTPGVGSAIVANTATTYEFIPQCDAVIFVTSVDSPLTRNELEFLTTIRQHVHKIFFVVNKTDLLAEAELREVLAFVRKTLRAQVGANDLRLFPLSCKLALAGSAESDLPALQEELNRFLSGEKMATFLGAIVDRALLLVATEAGEIALAKPAKELAPPELQQRLDAIHRQWQEQAAFRHNVFEKLRAQVLGRTHALLSPEIETFLGTEQNQWSAQLDRLLAHADWRPCVLYAKRLTEHALRRLRRRAFRWALTRAETLSLPNDGTCETLWGELLTNLGEIPRLAAVALGLEYSAKLAADNLRPWRLEVEFEQPFPPDMRWATRLPWWLRPLPARLVRPWLKSRFQCQHSRLIEAFKVALLVVMKNQVNAALDKLWEEVNKHATEIETRVHKTITGGFAEAPDELAVRLIERNLLALREAILHLPVTCERIEEQPVPSVEPITALKPTEPVATDLGKNLRTRECPVCGHLCQVVFGFLSQWQYALSTDEATQVQFAAELGFCPLHTWQLHMWSSPVGASAGYAKLAERVARLLKQADAPQGVQELVRDPQHCRVCRLLRDAEQKHAKELAGFLAEPAGRETYARSQGACLRHLAFILAASTNPEVRQFLLAEAARRFEEVAEEMQAFAMKTDALRHYLRNEDEKDAYVRAITHLAGNRGICVPWPRDMEL